MASILNFSYRRANFEKRLSSKKHLPFPNDLILEFKFDANKFTLSIYRLCQLSLEFNRFTCPTASAKNKKEMSHL